MRGATVVTYIDKVRHCVQRLVENIESSSPNKVGNVAFTEKYPRTQQTSLLVWYPLINSLTDPDERMRLKRVNSEGETGINEKEEGSIR